ncbi:MAG: Dihydroorotase [Syntrophorhabdaceae bacterium PtaU1.Bin034]|nr:MAG: Dihydroorotase [Syntrophorhabdaceae bacterium PtaU1.Bin034]
MTILIKKGRLIDPKSERDEIVDILIKGETIEKIDSNLSGADADEVIDAAGLIVAPGLIDVHAHLREPGYEWKETIRTGTMAAARGGFTSVVCMANTDPVNDNKSVTEYIMKKALAEGVVRVFPCGAVTKGLKGEDLSEMGEMHGAGIVAVSDDGKSVRNARLFLKAMEYAKLFNLAVICHCEDDTLAGGFVHEGSSSLLSGLDAIPSIAEEIIARRDIAIARYVQSPVHITHISTEGTVDIIRDEKEKYGKVTCDTCPHYFTLSDEATLSYDTSAKVNPPLRSRADMAAVKEGLRDGTIDIIATDHAPHDLTSKDVEFNLASFGISGLETAFALSLGLVHEGVLDLPSLLKKMTVNPARLLGLPYGEIAPGKTADLIVFDDRAEWTVDRKNFYSKGKNTPFEGFRLRGRNLLTIVNGRVAFRDAVIA